MAEGSGVDGGEEPLPCRWRATVGAPATEAAIERKERRLSMPQILLCAFDDQIRDDVGTISAGSLWWWRLVQQSPQRLAPPPREERIQIDVLAAKKAGHLPNHHVVFDEPAARCVEHGRVIGHTVGNDAVARLGDDDVDRGDEIDVGESMRVEWFLCD